MKHTMPSSNYVLQCRSLDFLSMHAQYVEPQAT